MDEPAVIGLVCAMALLAVILLLVIIFCCRHRWRHLATVCRKSRPLHARLAHRWPSLSWSPPWVRSRRQRQRQRQRRRKHRIRTGHSRMGTGPRPAVVLEDPFVASMKPKLQFGGASNWPLGWRDMVAGAGVHRDMSTVPVVVAMGDGVDSGGVASHGNFRGGIGMNTMLPVMYQNSLTREGGALSPWVEVVAVGNPTPIPAYEPLHGREALGVAVVTRHPLPDIDIDNNVLNDPDSGQNSNSGSSDLKLDPGGPYDLHIEAAIPVASSVPDQDRLITKSDSMDTDSMETDSASLDTDSADEVKVPLGGPVVTAPPGGTVPPGILKTANRGRRVHFARNRDSASDIGEKSGAQNASDECLRFLVVGDWGKGVQTDIAKQMNRWAGKHGCNFIVSTGDNFYPHGIAAPEDALVQERWSEVYQSEKMTNLRSLPWYLVLGDNDWGGNAQAQIDLTAHEALWNLPNLYHDVIKQVGDVTVHLVLFDTSVFKDDAHAKLRAEMLGWLDNTLTNSQATWKVLIGHTPLYSAGKNGPISADMYDAISYRLTSWKVDVIFSGHDHSLQLLQPRDGTAETYHVVSGGGGATPWGHDKREAHVDALRSQYGMEPVFFHHGNGFVGVTVTNSYVELDFRDVRGQSVFCTRKERDLS